jgi:hypothetical protein
MHPGTVKQADVFVANVLIAGHVTASAKDACRARHARARPRRRCLKRGAGGTSLRGRAP